MDLTDWFAQNVEIFPSDLFSPSFSLESLTQLEFELPLLGGKEFELLIGFTPLLNTSDESEDMEDIESSYIYLLGPSTS